jgi:hypothetical protein
MHNGITVKSDFESLKKENIQDSFGMLFHMTHKTIRPVPFLQLTRILQVLLQKCFSAIEHFSYASTTAQYGNTHALCQSTQRELLRIEVSYA